MAAFSFASWRLRDMVIPIVRMLLHRHGLPLEMARAVAEQVVDDRLCELVWNENENIGMTALRAEVLRHPAAYWWPWSEWWA